MPDVIHDNSQHANNRAEQSHEVTRVRERGMRGAAFRGAAFRGAAFRGAAFRRFKSVRQARRFLDALAAVSTLFNLVGHLVRAPHYRDLRKSEQQAQER
jgi:putative transposase